MDLTREGLDRVYRSLSDDDLELTREMNRRRAQGLVSEAEMLEFGAFLRRFATNVAGRKTPELSIAQLREISLRNYEELTAERERRAQLDGRSH